MAEETSKIHFVNTLLLVGVLITTTMMTCSNDRLEQKIIRLQKAVESGTTTSSAPTTAPAAGGRPTSSPA